VPLQEGIRFSRGAASSLPIGGAKVTFTHKQNGIPAVTFSRAGTASEFGGFYVRSYPRGMFMITQDTRGFQVERSTGRTERFMWIDATSTWMRVF
jgi:hypothetical protein